jgi:hypothetical protein
MTILDFIVFVFIIVVVSYFAYRSGFVEGQSAANRKHTQQLCRLRNENGILDKRTCDLNDRLDEMEERLSKAEFKLKHTLNMLHGRVVVKGTMPDGAADCELKYNHDSSEDTEDGVKAKIITSDMLDNAVKNQWETVKVMADEAKED